jgi:hypothetical protein
MSRDLLSSSGSLSRTWIESSAIDRLIDDHHRGLRANGRVLWTLLSLELWARAYAGDASTTTAKVERTPVRVAEPVEVMS